MVADSPFAKRFHLLGFCQGLILFIDFSGSGFHGFLFFENGLYCSERDVVVLGEVFEEVFGVAVVGCFPGVSDEVFGDDFCRVFRCCSEPDECCCNVLCGGGYVGECFSA